jgi:hypothetical protein
MDDDIAPWAAGVAMALLALFGLVVARGAVDLPFYIFGLALFLFGMACVFGLIARQTGGGLSAPPAPGEREASVRDSRVIAADPDERDAAMAASPAPHPTAVAPQPAAIASRA